MQKSTCRECNMSIYVVTGEDGTKIVLDTELISVVAGARPTNESTKITARRVHGEMCIKYQNDAARVAQRHLMKRAGNISAKRAKKG